MPKHKHRKKHTDSEENDSVDEELPKKRGPIVRPDIFKAIRTGNMTGFEDGIPHDMVIQKDKTGATPLIVGIKAAQENFIINRVMLSSVINCSDKSGKTALSYALEMDNIVDRWYNRRVNMVELLVMKGAFIKMDHLEYCIERKMLDEFLVLYGDPKCPCLPYSVERFKQAKPYIEHMEKTRFIYALSHDLINEISEFASHHISDTPNIPESGWEMNSPFGRYNYVSYIIGLIRKAIRYNYPDGYIKYMLNYVNQNRHNCYGRDPVIEDYLIDLIEYDRMELFMFVLKRSQDIDNCINQFMGFPKLVSTKTKYLEILLKKNRSVNISELIEKCLSVTLNSYNTDTLDLVLKYGRLPKDIIPQLMHNSYDHKSVLLVVNVLIAHGYKPLNSISMAAMLGWDQVVKALLPCSELHEVAGLSSSDKKTSQLLAQWYKIQYDKKRLILRTINKEKRKQHNPALTKYIIRYIAEF